MKKIGILLFIVLSLTACSGSYPGHVHDDKCGDDFKKVMLPVTFFSNGSSDVVIQEITELGLGVISDDRYYTIDLYRDDQTAECSVIVERMLELSLADQALANVTINGDMTDLSLFFSSFATSEDIDLGLTKGKAIVDMVHVLNGAEWNTVEFNVHAYDLTTNELLIEL